MAFDPLSYTSIELAYPSAYRIRSLCFAMVMEALKWYPYRYWKSLVSKLDILMYGVMQLRYFNSEGLLSKGEEQRTFPLRRLLGISFTCTKSLGNIWQRNLILRVVVFRLDQISIFLQVFSNRDSHLLFLWKIATSEIKEHHNRLRK